MSKCLRCGATSEWIEGKVRDEPSRIASLEADNEALRKVARALVDYWDRNEDGGDGVFEENMERFVNRFRAALSNATAGERKL